MARKENEAAKSCRKAMKFLKKAIPKKPKLTTYWTVESWEGGGGSFKNVSLIGKETWTSHGWGGPIFGWGPGLQN